MHRTRRFVDDVLTRLFNLPNHIMKRSFQPAISAVVLSAAMLQAVVPASAAVIVHNDGGTYDYPPLTAASDTASAYDTTRSIF